MVDPDPHVSMTPDGRYVVLSVNEGTTLDDPAAAAETLERVRVASVLAQMIRGSEDSGGFYDQWDTPPLWVSPDLRREG